MKYIILKLNTLQKEMPFIFPSELVHKDVRDAITHLLHRSLDSDITLISAGDINSVSGQCSGRSETCKVSSRGNVDTQLIKMYDYFHGV